MTLNSLFFNGEKMQLSLEKIGLTEKETKVYLAALELGNATVIALGKKAGINRVTTYVILKSLMHKGLISSLEKGKKTFFVAESPEHLEYILEKEQRDLEIKKEALEKTIPELKAIYNISDGKPKVKFYEGIEGLKAMQQDAAKLSVSGETVLAFNPLDLYRENFASKEYVKNRLNRQVKIKVIYTSKNGPVSDELNKKENREARFIPMEKFMFHSIIDIHPGSRVKMYSFKPMFTGVVIEDKKIAETMESIFKLAWEAAEKYNKKTNN